MIKVAADKGWTLVKSPVITMIRKATMPTSASRQKIAIVSATSMSVIVSMEVSDKRVLQSISYIWYPVEFQKNQANKFQVLIDSDSEVNAMAPAYAAKLGLTTRKISVGAQKIDSLPLKTHSMASARFSL